MSKKNYTHLFKLLIIGNSSVGKTCLLVKYVDDEFNSNFIATIGIDFKIKTVEIDGKVIKLQLWDTAGQERFRTITVSYYRGAMGILLLYSIADRQSFDEVEKWMKAIQTNATNEVQVILVGNKCDLEDKRTVTEKEGQELAKKHNALFIETSAKTGQNVVEAFERLTRQVLQNCPKLPDSQPLRIEANSPQQHQTGGSNCC